MKRCTSPRRWCAGLGSSHIDTRLRQQDFRGDATDALLPWLGMPIAELEQQRAVLVIGSDIRQEQPLLAHRLRKACLADGDIAFVTPFALHLTHPSRQLVCAPGAMAAELAAIAKALGQDADGLPKALFASAEVGETHQRIADALRSAGQAGAGAVLLGAVAEAHPDYALLKALGHRIADAASCRIGFLPRAANSVGAALAGAMPHRAPGAKPVERSGLDALAMLTDPRKGYLLWGIEPDRDLIDPAAAMVALDGAAMVIACASMRSTALDSVADILLPISAFAETAGTFVNAECTPQRFQGAVPPPGEARPGWKVLRVLGQLLELTGFNQSSARDVYDELMSSCAELAPDNRPVATPRAEVTLADTGLVRVGNVPIYAVDPLVRAAPALQATPLADPFAVSLNPEQADEFGLSDGDQVRVRQNGYGAQAPVVLDPACPRGSARIPAGVPGSESLGVQIGPIELEKV